MANDTDWARVRALSDVEIINAVAEDRDTFIPDAAWMSKARLVTPQPTEIVTSRLDPAVWNDSEAPNAPTSP